MQPRQPVKIKLTPAIVSIFEDYEAARPRDMERSYTAMSAPGKEKSLELDVATQMDKAATAGIMGAVGGVKGVGAAVAYTGVKVLAENIYNYFTNNKDKTLYLQNFEYLKEKTFDDNNNLAEALYTDQEVIKKRKATLQKLYNYTCEYQRLKGTRFGMSLFGFTIGENRDDEQISDFKYLINILIGRKLMLAAKAENFQAYKKHLEHLCSFLDKIVTNHELFRTNSNDEQFLSLRTVTNIVRKSLLEENERQGTLDRSEMLKQLTLDIANITNETQNLLNDVQERTTHLVCAAKPQEFLQSINPSALAPNLTDVKKFDNNTYLGMLREILYKNNKPSENDLNVFINGMLTYTGVSGLSEEKKSSIKSHFETLTNNKIKLQNLIALLEKAKAIQGINPYVEMSERFIYLLKEIKKAQFALIKSQRAFVDVIAEHCYPTSNNTNKFKDNFTQFAYKALRVNVKPCNDAIIALEEINLNQKEIKLDIERDTKKALEQLGREIDEAGYKADQPESHLESVPESNEDDTALESWVMVNLEQSLTTTSLNNFKNKVPSEVKELTWFQKKFTDAEKHLKQQENFETRLQQNDMKIKAQDAAIKQLQSEKEKLEKALADEKAKTAALQAEKNVRDKIDGFGKLFNVYINNYTKSNEKSRGWLHFHGTHGLEVADKFSKKFAILINELRSDNTLTPANIDKELHDRFIKLLRDNKSLLDGNHHAHSLKTYLLQLAVSLEQNSSLPGQLSLFRVQGDSSKIKALYKQETSLNKQETSLKL